MYQLDGQPVELQPSAFEQENPLTPVPLNRLAVFAVSDVCPIDAISIDPGVQETTFSYRKVIQPKEALLLLRADSSAYLLTGTTKEAAFLGLDARRRLSLIHVAKSGESIAAFCNRREHLHISRPCAVAAHDLCHLQPDASQQVSFSGRRTHKPGLRRQRSRPARSSTRSNRHDASPRSLRKRQKARRSANFCFCNNPTCRVYLIPLIGRTIPRNAKSPLRSMLRGHTPSSAPRLWRSVFSLKTLLKASSGSVPRGNPLRSHQRPHPQARKPRTPAKNKVLHPQIIQNETRVSAFTQKACIRRGRIMAL